jgi:hypothetical protein
VCCMRGEVPGPALAWRHAMHMHTARGCFNLLHMHTLSHSHGTWRAWLHALHVHVLVGTHAMAHGTAWNVVLPLHGPCA